jgi:beta-lactamase superfamily II metal-dependent hydrolase
MKISARLLFITLFAAVIAAAGRAGQTDKTLDIYWIDSEGGGSTLIVTPNNESVLIDTGNPGGRDSSRIIAAAKAAGLTKIDYVLLTHYHIDHFGGGAEVAQRLPIGTIFERGIPQGDPDGNAQSSFQLQIKPWREIAAKREKLIPGAIIPLEAVHGGPKLELQCIAADKKRSDPTAAQKKVTNPLMGEDRTIPPSDNDNSAVFVLTFGGFKFFDGGDLTWSYEKNLVSPHNIVGLVDVYQTDHHGLDVSNNPVLLQSIKPTVAVMNNGAKKGGSAIAFASLKSVPSLQARYQLHKSYNVPAEDNAAEEFVANHENLVGGDAARCDANLIKLSVAPDGKSYTMSIPATGHARTFQTTQK